MAFLQREYGGIQPSIPVAMLRIRIPFVHFKISPPEIVTGLMNACTSYGALAVLTGTLGLAIGCGKRVPDRRDRRGRDARLV